MKKEGDYKISLVDPVPKGRPRSLSVYRGLSLEDLGPSMVDLGSSSVDLVPQDSADPDQSHNEPDHKSRIE